MYCNSPIKQGRIQFFIEAVETGLPNIIDSLLVDLDDLQLGADFTEERTYSGYHNISHMTMSFRVECDTGFCGDDCTVTTTNNPRIQSCQPNGDIVCIDGRYDPSKDCNSCLHNLDFTRDCSTCLQPNFDPDSNCTTCLPGYDTGLNCSQCLPNRELSSNCTMCWQGWDIESDCLSCLLPRRDSQTNCTVCIQPERYSDADCNVCVLPGGDPETQCQTCLDNRGDPDANCTIGEYQEVTLGVFNITSSFFQ